MNDQHDGIPEPERPSDLFIEFANSLEFEDGEPVDHVGDGSRLIGWLERNGLGRGRIGSSRAAVALPRFRDLRALTRQVVERLAQDAEPTAAQVRRLNSVLRGGTHYHRLRRDAAGTRFTVGQVGDELDQALAAIAGSLAHYLADHDGRRLKICADDDCRWLFVDRSPARRRRWCDMRTCGNRAKVATHRARARARTAGSEPTPDGSASQPATG